MIILYSSNYRLLVYPTGSFSTRFSSSLDPLMSDLWRRDLMDRVGSLPKSYDDLEKIIMNESEMRFFLYIQCHRQIQCRMTIMRYTYVRLCKTKRYLISSIKPHDPLSTFEIFADAALLDYAIGPLALSESYSSCQMVATTQQGIFPTKFAFIVPKVQPFSVETFMCYS